MRFCVPVTLSLLFALGACSSNDNNPSGAGGGGESPGNGGSGGKGGSTETGGGGSGGKPPNFGGGTQTGPMFAGAECPTDVGFSDAYALSNVKGEIDGSNVRISFDPQGDAKDYRVYVLPKSGDISGDSVQGAVYRCAGNYAIPYPGIEDAKEPDSPGVRTRVTTKVKGYQRTAEDATLGYVFTTPADDRIPVYALGDPDVRADNTMCYFMRWPESRVKKYTTSADERDQLLAKRWRDYGVVFYVPKPGAEGSAPIYTTIVEAGMTSAASLYVTGGAEYQQRKKDGNPFTEAFSVYSETREGAEPLMRVFYDYVCGQGHDELVAGLGRFNKAYNQGSQPVQELHFSGLTKETTLVVEALDQLCPFQGIVAPISRPARVDPFSDYNIDYPAFQTPDELAAASKSGEVFINGQGDGTKPRAIARACLKVKPATPPEADWRYDGSPETFTEPVMQMFQTWQTESDNFNVQFHTMATDEYSLGTLFGELWATYGDWAADTNGKLRITPKERATLSADKYVHATMEVDTVSTQRRYPQLLVSSAEWPVQDNLEKGVTVIVQTFGGITEPLEVQLQLCDHRTWDVNNQCPRYPLYVLKDGSESFTTPGPEIDGFNGVDRTVRFDVYVSGARAYVLTNGLPYGCAVLPTDKLPAGPATVTFGDVLYHSAVDLAPWYPFHIAKYQNVTSRHFSNLSFSSGVDAPPWDESRIPCVAPSEIKE